MQNKSTHEKKSFQASPTHRSFYVIFLFILVRKYFYNASKFTNAANPFFFLKKLFLLPPYQFITVSQSKTSNKTHVTNTTSHVHIVLFCLTDSRAHMILDQFVSNRCKLRSENLFATKFARNFNETKELNF